MPIIQSERLKWINRAIFSKNQRSFSTSLLQRQNDKIKTFWSPVLEYTDKKYHVYGVNFIQAQIEVNYKLKKYLEKTPEYKG